MDIPALKQANHFYCR